MATYDPTKPRPGILGAKFKREEPFIRVDNPPIVPKEGTLGNTIIKGMDRFKTAVNNVNSIPASNGSPGVLRSLKNIETPNNLDVERGILKRASGNNSVQDPTGLALAEAKNRTDGLNTSNIINPNQRPSMLKRMNQPGGYMEITSGPRKGMSFTAPASGGQIKAFDAQRNSTDLPYSDNVTTGDVNKLSTLRSGQDTATGFQAGQTYRTPTGLDITPGEGLSNKEMLGLMRTPVHGGTRMLSGLSNPNQSQENSREAELWKIATTSKFPRARETAMDGLRMLQGGKQFNTTMGTTEQQNAITNQQKARELDIDQQKANSYSDYNKYLADNKDKKKPSKWSIKRIGNDDMGTGQDVLFNEDGQMITLNEPPKKGEAIKGSIYKSSSGPVKYLGLNEAGEPIYEPFKVQ